MTDQGLDFLRVLRSGMNERNYVDWVWNQRYPEKRQYPIGKWPFVRLEHAKVVKLRGK